MIESRGQNLKQTTQDRQTPVAGEPFLGSLSQDVSVRESQSKLKTDDARLIDSSSGRATSGLFESRCKC